MAVSAGHASYGNKPAALEIGNSKGRGRPNSGVIGLIEGVHIIIGQSTSLAVNRNLPVIPSVQAITRAEPNATIPRRQNGRNEVIRQTLRDRNCRDGEVAKAVETIVSG